ncbi:MAG: nucleotide exchange factor GrpE [Schwartzia sp. (in: firmicutes)]
MPFMKDKLKKKDEAELEDMQEQMREAERSGTVRMEEAESATEGAEAAFADEVAASSLVAENEKLSAELAEREERYLRLQADFENFRRRTRQEKEELAAVVTQSLLKDMLPLLDNFERALVADKSAETFHQGVEMIYKQMVEALKKNGLEYIETAGQKFDPNFHEAVMRVQNPEKEDDDIALEMQKGYMAKGRVIRPSMVQVVAN